MNFFTIRKYAAILSISSIALICLMSGSGCFPLVMRPVQMTLEIKNETDSSIVFTPLSRTHDANYYICHAGSDTRFAFFHEGLLAIGKEGEKIYASYFYDDFTHEMTAESEIGAITYSVALYRIRFSNGYLIYRKDNGEEVRIPPCRRMELLDYEKDKPPPAIDVSLMRHGYK